MLSEPIQRNLEEVEHKERFIFPLVLHRGQAPPVRPSVRWQQPFNQFRTRKRYPCLHDENSLARHLVSGRYHGARRVRGVRTIMHG
jgi:hypothetical protein